MASRTFEVFYKIVITWDSFDDKVDFLSKLLFEDAKEMANEMIDLGIAKYEFVEVREV